MTSKSNHQLRVELLHAGIRHMDPRTPPDPLHPTFPRDLAGRKARARLLYEECIETIEALGFHVMAMHPGNVGVTVLDKNPDSVGWLVQPPASLPELAKEISDVIVVMTGTLSHCGIPDDTLLELVDQNNLEKIATGTVNKFGKIVKHPLHPKPDIAGMLRTLGWREEV